VNPRQPAVFFVPRGRGGYSVVVHRSDRKRGTKAFDSRELREGDVFTVTPIRSGVYSFTNRNAAKGEVVVGKPKGRTVPTEPVIVECQEKGFKPSRLKAEFSQPLFYLIKALSRIRIKQEAKGRDKDVYKG
jgi:hypothetical protein